MNSHLDWINDPELRQLEDDRRFRFYYDSLWTFPAAWTLFNEFPNKVEKMSDPEFGVNRIINGVHLLEKAILYANEKVLEKLLQLGANPNAMAKFGFHNHTLLTAMMYFEKKDTLNKIKLLLRYGANPNVQNIDGDTPLHIAVRHHRFEYIKTLLGHGVNCFIVNKNQDTPLDLSICLNCNIDIIKLLSNYENNVKNRAALLLLAYYSDENSLCNRDLSLDVLKILITYVTYKIDIRYENDKSSENDKSNENNKSSENN